ncbi:MAG: nitroreductase family protein [Deltaproteobacteria bacterium]|nr:nitroreductase family protein [Deltaproteobacteria bacterium]
MRLKNNENNSIIDLLTKKMIGNHINTSNEIEDKELLILIEAARLAPSADNSQIWRFLILKQKERIKKISDTFKFSSKNYNKIIITLAAPFILKHIRREHPFYAIDVPIAISHILLQGLELGIMTDIHFIFENEEIYNILPIPQKYKPVAILGLYKYELIK